MIDLNAPNLVWAGFVLACVFLYSAAHEFKAENLRDARLLAATGVLSLVGLGAVTYL